MGTVPGAAEWFCSPTERNLPVAKHVERHMTVAATTRWVDRSAGRWFYAGMAAACILLSIASFAPSLANPARPGSFTWLTLLHGSASTAWLLIFLAQTLLVQTGRVAVHRRLGTASLFLAAAMVVLGYATVVAMGRRGFDLSGDLGVSVDPPGAAFQMIFPLLDIAAFGILVAAGYVCRRRADVHKRLMLFATIAMLPAPLAHLIGHSPVLRSHGVIIIPLLAITLVASAVYDLIRFRRVHPVSLWVGITLFIADNLCATVVAPSATWRQFVGWMIS